MKRHPKYRIRIEDESHLESMADFSLSPYMLWGLGALAAILLLIIAGVIVSVTPIRTLLPGYLKQSERAATEDNLLRLDSVLWVYESNQTYIDNALRVLDTGRIPVDSATITSNITEFSPDSLIPASQIERKFVSTMEEREKYNISVLAPLAADGIMFSPVSDNSVYAAATRSAEKGEIILPPNEAVRCVADGTILATFYSPSENGYVAIIQHQKGFVTRCSRLGTPMVADGDVVQGGQILSLGPEADAKGKRFVEIMMWHNGHKLVPYEYIGNPESYVLKDPPFEAPRGR